MQLSSLKRITDTHHKMDEYQSMFSTQRAHIFYTYFMKSSKTGKINL